MLLQAPWARVSAMLWALPALRLTWQPATTSPTAPPLLTTTRKVPGQLRCGDLCLAAQEGCHLGSVTAAGLTTVVLTLSTSALCSAC